MSTEPTAVMRALLQEAIDLCLIGDIDENSEHEGWAGFVRDAKRILAASPQSSIGASTQAEEAQDVARYQWLAENAIIETPRWRHDGKDPASTKHVLDRAIDAAMAEEGKHGRPAR